MKTNNTIDLNDYLKQRKAIPTFDRSLRENLELEKQTLLRRRILSFGLDFAMILFLKNMVTMAYAIFLSDFLAQVSPLKKVEMLQMGLPWELGVFGVVFFSYFLISTYTFEGKTLGNKWMKLNIINDDYPFNYESSNYAPHFKQALMRSLSYGLCYLSFGLFFLLTLLSKDRRGLADALSQTRTVSDQWLRSYQLEKIAYQEQVRIDINSLDSNISRAA